MTGAAGILHVQAYQHASLDSSMIHCNRQVRGHRVEWGEGGLSDVVCIQISAAPLLQISTQSCDFEQTQSSAWLQTLAELGRCRQEPHGPDLNCLWMCLKEAKLMQTVEAKHLLTPAIKT